MVEDLVALCVAPELALLVDFIFFLADGSWVRADVGGVDSGALLLLVEAGRWLLYGWSTGTWRC